MKKNKVLLFGTMFGVMCAVLLLAACSTKIEDTPTPTSDISTVAAVIPATQESHVESIETVSSPTQNIETTETQPAIPTLDVEIQISSIDGMGLVFVPEGEFLMGSERGIGDKDEEPQHLIKMTGFWIDQIEVTNAMYKKCVDAGVCSNPQSLSSYSRSDYFLNPDFSEFPVINVDWYQATKYCQWAGRRLPTEAEWEFAASGIENRIFPWGSDHPNKSLANYGYNEVDTAVSYSYLSGSSPYGALNMAGNVAEWVSDWYGIYALYNDPNPKGPATGKYHILRGGSWLLGDFMVRNAERYWVSAYFYDEDTGFRCAMDDE